jgi:hypothetical protein
MHKNYMCDAYQTLFNEVGPRPNLSTDFYRSAIKPLISEPTKYVARPVHDKLTHTTINFTPQSLGEQNLVNI